jgi:hypothetical protein
MTREESPPGGRDDAPGRDAPRAASDAAPTPNDNGDGQNGTPLPQDVIDEAARLTRLARRVADPGEREAYRDKRAQLLDDWGYTARIREEDDTLVLYPAEWVDDGVVQFDRIDDVDRGVEIPLSGPGDGDDWAAIEAANAAVVATVAEEHGAVHAATARALADFMGNHYAKRIERVTAEELREFREEYFVRNAWPSEEQRQLLGDSLAYTVEAAGGDVPLDVD